MKRAAPLLMATISALAAHAQAPRPERLESCSDAVLVAGETYEFASGPRGRGGSVDWIHCASPRSVYALGAASYSVADSRWTIAKAAGSFQARDGAWLSADANAGSGRNAMGSFDYLTVREGVTVRPFERFFAKVEHQYLRVADEHGHVFKVAGIVMPLPRLLAEISGSRSAGGNLGTRNVAARLDWVEPFARFYAGYAHGRTTPQAVDLVTGERLPDTRSRETFAGFFVPLAGGELGFAFDEVRAPASRRRTWGASVKWPLP
jgi:hypothetical protein